MNVTDALYSRYSTRAFKPDSVDKETITRILEAARQTIFEANYRFFGAPAVIYLCMNRTLTPWSIFDIGISSHLILT